MVCMPQSLRTQKPVLQRVIGPIMRRSGCPLLRSRPPISGALAMPKSASPRPTIGDRSPVSPAVGCTSMLRPAFSFSTLAMAELVVWLSVPGCIVAKPKVCADGGRSATRAAPAAPMQAAIQMSSLQA